MKPWRGLDWKTLARHPLSAEYPDLGPKARAAALVLFEKHGYVGDDPIYLATHSSDPGVVKVLDGWQRQCLCVEAGVEPVYVVLTNNDPPLEDFVAIRNDTRRHEDPVARKKRADERLSRVAAARIAGESIRTIAKREEVHPKTVERDLEKAAGVAGATPEPAAGRISGSDGKVYAAPPPKPSPFCDRCTRIGKPVKNCPGCAEKAAAKPAKSSPATVPVVPPKKTRGPGKVYTWAEALDLAGALMRTFDGLRPPKKEHGEEVERVRGMIFDVHDSMFKLSREK